MKVLYLDQVGGVSGDMFLAALIDLGVDVSALEAAVRGLGLPDVRLTTRAVTRAGLNARHLEVSWAGQPAAAAPDHAANASSAAHHEHHHHPHPHSHPHPHPHAHVGEPEHSEPERGGESSEPHGHGHGVAHGHRGYSEIVRMIRGAPLSERVKERALAVFLRLGEAEAQVHGTSLDEVHFHEVGAVDSLVDIVGVCWALDELRVEQVHSSPFVFGRGEVTMAHGRWPVPAPATLRLTEGFPVELRPIRGETVTPTGAALVTALASSVGQPLSLVLERTGVGAGSRDSGDRPNVLRALLGEVEVGGDAVEVLETALDDLAPQRLARLATLLLSAGALDVWTTPTVMKKGRSGHLLTVLAPIGRGGALGGLIFAESTTLGLRRRVEGRLTLPRRIGQVDTPWGAVRVKVADLPDGTSRQAPEFDDCQRLAVDSGVPLEDIIEMARKAAVHFPPDS